MIKTSICTLFEKDFHYGVGALVNSLYRQGFRGDIWVGYRGNLPFWAKHVKPGNGYYECSVEDGIIVRFISLTTKNHFTNYKPDFLLKIWEEFSPDTEAIFYIDPDIIIKCRWSFFEEWVSYGVALCEDVNSPMPNTHPLRMGWRHYYKKHGFNLSNNVETYVNGGFVGLKKENIMFLYDWKKIQDLMEPLFGGLVNANFKDRSFLFCKTDQDALNIALMNTQCSVSLMGKEAMDIIPGGFVMSHALGTPKPWNKNFILFSLKGRRPSLAEKQHWKYTQYPLKLYSQCKVLSKKIELLLGSAISRLLG